MQLLFVGYSLVYIIKDKVEDQVAKFLLVLVHVMFKYPIQHVVVVHYTHSNSKRPKIIVTLLCVMMLIQIL